MTDQAKDANKSQTDSKKQPGTVLLTAEELRAIAGGATINPVKTVPTPDVETGRKH